MRDSVQITYLGHAGLRLDGADLKLLMDPWLSTGGAFQGAWFQYPSNTHVVSPALLDTDYVTVSHEHLDHMDSAVLSRLPERTKVLVPRYPSPLFRDRLRRLGVRNVIEVEAWERYQLNGRGDWLTFIPERSPMCHDAAVLVHAGGAGVLHCNDARLTLAQSRRAAHECGGTLDVMLMQTAGASWHPICYEYSPEEMDRISAIKRTGKLKAAAQLFRKVGPDLAVPFAGPMCFLDSELRQHNRWMDAPGIFPDTAQAADYLEQRLPEQQVGRWLPGDTYDPLARVHTRDQRWDGFSYAARDEYLHGYALERQAELAGVHAAHPTPGPELGDAFVEHFRRLGEMSDYFLSRIDMTVRFELTGELEGRWDVDLRPDGVRVDLGGGSPEHHYRFRLDPRWLAPVIAGQIAWEDLFLSLRFSAWRDPDIYNDYLIGLLKHADPEALAAVEAYETNRTDDERLTVRSAGDLYEIGRYCPHAGEDLAVGGVLLEGGLIRCLGHNLEFELATGTCVNARCDPMFTRRVPPEQEPLRTAGGSFLESSAR